MASPSDRARGVATPPTASSGQRGTIDDSGGDVKGRPGRQRPSAPGYRALDGARQRQTEALVNVLFITLDQFRGDCLSSAGHPLVRTPNLDELAAHGVRLSRHYSQAAPCSPGRAALYTGTYQMN